MLLFSLPQSWQNLLSILFPTQLIRNITKYPHLRNKRVSMCRKLSSRGVWIYCKKKVWIYCVQEKTKRKNGILSFIWYLCAICCCTYVHVKKGDIFCPKINKKEKEQWENKIDWSSEEEVSEQKCANLLWYLVDLDNTKIFIRIYFQAHGVLYHY